MKSEKAQIIIITIITIIIFSLKITILVHLTKISKIKAKITIKTIYKITFYINFNKEIKTY
jgi:hypothetical protein